MKTFLPAGAILFFLSMSSLAAAAPMQMQTTPGGNVYISGSDLVITTSVAADLLAAGGHISVEREVGADAALAGGSITIRAPVKQDLRVAGGNVDIDANIGGELVAAGGTVRVGSASTVASSAWLAGSNISIAGKVEKGARIYANSITISGQIDGDTHLVGKQITLNPGAKINGNLFYASPNELSRDAAAQVLGTITRQPMPEGKGKSHRAGLLWFRAICILALLAAGLLLYLLFPHALSRPQQAIREHPVRSLLLGVAILFTVPPLAILFMVSVIGIPIGFVLLLLYPVSLLLGYLASAFLIGAQVATAMKQPEPVTLKRHALYLGLALIVLTIAAAIPFVGGLVTLAAIVFGLGGWASTLQKKANASTMS